jgi:hypothetical protein
MTKANDEAQMTSQAKMPDSFTKSARAGIIAASI